MLAIAKLKDELVDSVWPRATGKLGKELDPQPRLLPKHAGFNSAIAENIAILSAGSEERLRSVDRKLTSLLALTTVLFTVITAGLVSTTTLHTPEGPAKYLAWISGALFLYIEVQLFRSILATVDGLQRRGFFRLTRDSIVPKDSESGGDCYGIRVQNELLDIIEQNDRTVNSKVTQMAIAHRAMKNALWGALLLGVLVFAIAALKWAAS